MAGEIRLTLVQAQPALGDLDRNIQKVGELIAAHPESDLIVLPELFLSGYTTFGIEKLAVEAQGPELESLCAIARESSTALIVGAPERTGSGIANSAFCIDETGELAGVYRKVQLYGTENEAFVSGDELVLVELCGVRIGLMICFDVEFPEVARALARAGAELLVTISANMEPFGRDHEVFVTARALENGLPHAYVNQVGSSGRLVFTGGSRIVSPDGEAYAAAGNSGEEALTVALRLPQKSRVREDYLAALKYPTPAVTKLRS